MSEGLGTHTPDLFSKVGPLPAWAWGAVVVGGYLAYTHFTASSSSVPAAVDATDGTTNTADNLDTGDPSLIDSSGLDTPTDPSVAGYSYGDVNAGNYGGTTGGTTFASNQAWLVYAIDGLVRQGYSVSTTTTALTYYLAGRPLTQGEAAIVTAAIQAYGTPPLPQPITLVTAPAPASSGTLPAPHVTGTAIAGHRARLSWNKISGASAYQIDRVTPKGGTFSSIQPTYTTSVWRKGTRLTFRVRAVSFTGKRSAWSNQVSVTIK